MYETVGGDMFDICVKRYVTSDQKLINTESHSIGIPIYEREMCMLLNYHFI